jgi:hypothetical protein
MSQWKLYGVKSRFSAGSVIEQPSEIESLVNSIIFDFCDAAYGRRGILSSQSSG